MDPGAQLFGVAGGHPVIDRLLLGTERAAVTGRPVNLVVQALGQGEEVRLAGDDGPPPVHAGALDVSEIDGEHLGHAAAEGRRVDVPDDPVPDPPADVRRESQQPG